MTTPKGGARGHGAPQDSAIDATAVTLADSALTDGPTRAVYVGTGGDLKVTMVGGTALTFKNVANGQLLPIQVTQLWTTGTTASDVIALY